MCTSLARQAILVETCAWNSFQLQDTDALCCQISCCCLPVQRLGHLRAPCPRRVPIGACLGNYIACRLCRVLDGSLFCSHTRGRGLTFTSAHVLVRAPVDGPGFPPTDQRDHTQCAVRALVPTLAVCPPHVCHRQRDWAVSLGWHMQQDMGISKAPPHPGAPFPLTHAVHVRKPRYKKSAIVSPETWLSFVSVTTRVFRPAGRILHSGVTKIITEFTKVLFHVIAVRDLPLWFHSANKHPALHKITHGSGESALSLFVKHSIPL